MQFIGPVGISGYAPWVTWLEITIVVAGVAAAVAVGVRLAKRHKKDWKALDRYLLETFKSRRYRN